MNNANRSIDVGFLQDGFVQANYRMKTGWGDVFPFARWNYYDGARKLASNAPPHQGQRNRLRPGMVPLARDRAVADIHHTFQRTDTTDCPYRNVEGADRLGFQLQWNY